MTLTTVQIHLRRFGPNPHARRPRNPTASDRAAGHWPLSPSEWAELRDWQRREIKHWTYEPGAIARRKALTADLDAGRVGHPVPDPPMDIHNDCTNAEDDQPKQIAA